MLYPWLSIIDLQNLYSHVKKPLQYTEEAFSGYTIVVPIFNSSSYIQNLGYLRKYREHVVIASTSKQTDEMKQFLILLEKEGFAVKIVDADPIPLETYYTIMKQACLETTTKYVCFLDGDSTPEDDLGKAVAVMEKEALDVASVQVLTSTKKSFIERMQSIEYSIAMRARHYYPWLTSGACCLGRTSVFRQIMQTHSLYFSGGDIEIGTIAKAAGKKVGYIEFKVYTNIPRSFVAWFKQRIDWFGGTFRLFGVNFDKYLLKSPSPLLLTYMLGFVFLLLPLKMHDLYFYWYDIPLILLLYIPITFSNWPVFDKYMVLYPIYGGFQVIVLPFLGFLRYLQLLIKYRRSGRIHLIHLPRKEVMREEL